MKHCKYVWFTASTLLFLGCGTVAAQEPHVSVAWKIAPACAANFPSTILQQDLEDQLRDASIAVSRVHTAGLLADINCEAAGARSISVQECLNLSEAVADPSVANGLHLATTWRNCKSYLCSGQNCGRFGVATQRALIGQFVPAFRAQSAKSKAADPPPVPESGITEGAAAQVIWVAVSKPVLKPSVIFYILYILTCIAVLIRWQWCH